MKVAVLGAGISGLSLAWKLLEAGHEVHILEKNGFVGGLAGTVRENGYCLDFGPHSFFSEDAGIVETVLGLFEQPPQAGPRTVEFFFKGKYLDYPLTPKNVLVQMGLWSGVKSGLSFLKSKLWIRSKKDGSGDFQTVEDWAIDSFGNHLYQTFFKPYTEQFWKMDCTDLSPRSIPYHTRTSFTNTLRVLLNQKATKSGESLIEREKLPTYYPKTGYGEIPEKVAEKVLSLGGNIYLNAEVRTLRILKNGKFQIDFSGEGSESQMEADYTVSTIPLNVLSKIIEPAPAKEVQVAGEKIKYRHLITLSLITSKQNILSSSYIYMLNKPYNRITEMNRFSPDTSPPGKNIIMLEIPFTEDSGAWQESQAELFESCLKSLTEDGLLTRDDVEDYVFKKADHAYPVYTKDYQQNLTRLVDYLETIENFDILGRTGEFMYMDIDKCMRRAFTLSEKIIKKWRYELV